MKNLNVFYGPLEVYIKKLGILCPTRSEVKTNRSRRRPLFRGSKSPERGVNNLTSYPAPMHFYESTLKKKKRLLGIFTEILQNDLLVTGSLKTKFSNFN